MNLTKKLDQVRKELSEKRERTLSALREDWYEDHISSKRNLRTLPEYLRIGDLTKGDYIYPALFPTASIAGFAFELNDSNREEVNMAVEAMAFQLIRLMDARYRSITVIDPRKLGGNFKSLRRVEKVVVDEDEVKKAIQHQYNESIRIVRECLLHYSSIDEYNASTGEIQPYRILVIADFPYGHRDSLDKLNTLVNNAKEAGLFVLMTYDKTIDLGSTGASRVAEILRQLVTLVPSGDRRTYRVKGTREDGFYNSEFLLDPEDPAVVAGRLREEADAMLESSSREVSFDITRGIRIPIGKVSGLTHYLTLGMETDNYHGIIGGQPGKGKTTLLNNIIAGGIRQYSKDELTFVLIDCAGVGFQEYAGHPQVLKLCSSSRVDDCIGAVEYLESILTEREKLFREARVMELRDYIKKTGQPLPRVLAVIDEFHVLFTGSNRTSSFVETVLVDRVIRIGRKFGVHLIVSTQSLGSGVRRSILDNIPLRIALGMTSDQSAGFLGYNNEGAVNLERGLALYNNENGAPGANKLVRVPFLSSEDIEKMIKKA